MRRTTGLLAVLLAAGLAFGGCRAPSDDAQEPPVATFAPTNAPTSEATATAPPTRPPPASKADPDDAELIALGEAVYLEQCASCHGVNLEGQPNWRRRNEDGTLPAPPHDASGHTWHHPDSMLFEITKFGTSAFVGGGYKSNMEGFGDRLSDVEIWASLAYIKSHWSATIRSLQPK